jgi:hypothetical protein
MCKIVSHYYIYIWKLKSLHYEILGALYESNVIK